MMTTVDKLKELMRRCKCSVTVTVNEHRDYYEDAAAWFEEREGYGDTVQVDKVVKAVMIATDTVIDIQFYPDTPIGFYNVYHHDLDAALDECLDCFKETEPQHVCGLQGFGRGEHEALNDVCPACEASRVKRLGEQNG